MLVKAFLIQRIVEPVLREVEREKWLIIFLRAGLSVQKPLVRLNYIGKSIFKGNGKEENSFVTLASTFFRVLSRMTDKK